MREIQLQGAGLGDLGWELATLGGWLALSFVASIKLFKWQ